MKQTKTLAQVANDIENGNNLHEYYNNDGATIKTGSFESFGDFLSYFDMHYRPILEQVADGITPIGNDARLLRLLASDLLAAFKTEDSDESEEERKDREWQEFLDREAEKQNSFAEGMRVTVPAASLTDGEAFVIVTIRRKAADNGGNASLTVKNETTGDVRNINGSDVEDILPPLEPASEITEAEGDKDEDPILTEAVKRDTLCRLWDAAWQQAQQDPETYRVIVETNEEDPSANCNPFGRYYMVDGSESESCIEHAGQWVVIRVDTVTSPYEVHRPNWAAAHGYRDDETQLSCRCENPNNVTRWARLMIDAGRVTDIYADCY